MRPQATTACHKNGQSFPQERPHFPSPKSRGKHFRNDKEHMIKTPNHQDRKITLQGPWPLWYFQIAILPVVKIWVRGHHILFLYSEFSLLSKLLNSVYSTYHLKVLFAPTHAHTYFDSFPFPGIQFSKEKGINWFQTYFEGGSSEKCPHSFCTGIGRILRDSRKEETQPGELRRHSEKAAL